MIFNEREGPRAYEDEHAATLPKQCGMQGPHFFQARGTRQLMIPGNEQVRGESPSSKRTPFLSLSVLRRLPLLPLACSACTAASTSASASRRSSSASTNLAIAAAAISARHAAAAAVPGLSSPPPASDFTPAPAPAPAAPPPCFVLRRLGLLGSPVSMFVSASAVADASAASCARALAFALASCAAAAAVAGLDGVSGG